MGRLPGSRMIDFLVRSSTSIVGSGSARQQYQQPVVTRCSVGDPRLAPRSAPLDSAMRTGFGQPRVMHALIVIFLEYFAWGLLTNPMITVLNETFPNRTFLMNGLIVGVKGILSFLSAPLLGALSDIWGRKSFLLVTVFFTCAPIPLMRLNTWWYFACISISGAFAVTFSVVFAYVADVTTPQNRSRAYGMVSATFAASLITSPALGAYLSRVYDTTFVVSVATAIALLDVLFILVAVPESLGYHQSTAAHHCYHKQQHVISLSWQQADPFTSLRHIGRDRMLLLLATVVFLSYLPEAGQYSCFFVYLRLVMHFSEQAVAAYIATVGILSVFAQTVLLTLLMRCIGPRSTILVGLCLEALQLMCCGLAADPLLVWVGGLMAAVSSLAYPAISALVSLRADVDTQGVVQGIVTGVRGLCLGLGPALYGCIFYLFNVDLDLSGDTTTVAPLVSHAANGSSTAAGGGGGVPGPPFVLGSMLVVLAAVFALFIPDAPPRVLRRTSGGGSGGGGLGAGGDGKHKKSDSVVSGELVYEFACATGGEEVSQHSRSASVDSLHVAGSVGHFVHTAYA